ncbi:hypothetical protein NUW58_g3457 [Xylaria curta]|uniref:Uncharacterized protein n=1 Tax=Xylaria curta TaxID=42375 RepID=A0ACC1PCG9_9PEZI|nr:hypothetical protein NUW58_g3457 [Xylaria curta]
MTTPSPTASPTLSENWEPTSSRCLRTEDYWIWFYDPDKADARTVLGGPSQTTDCFSSSFNPTITHAGSACPPQYTAACPVTNSDAAVTCCPTAHSFVCQTDPFTIGYNHLEWFRCISRYNTKDVVTVTKTDFRQGTTTTETRSRQPSLHLFALGLMYTTPPPTSSLPTTPLPTSSPDPTTTSTSAPAEGSSGLSAGASAGIGVGSAAAVIILALLAWFMYRRGKSAGSRRSPSELPGSVPPTAYNDMTGGSHGASQYSSPYSDQHASLYSGQHESPYSGQHATSYLAQPLASPPPKELPSGQDPRFELDADSNIQPNR